MNKLYFLETNGGYMTVATNADGRACYMWQDGKEENYPVKNPSWNDAEPEQRKQIAKNYLETLKSWNDFDSLYSDCDTSSGYTGVFTAEEFECDLEDGSSIIAEIDF